MILVSAGHSNTDPGAVNTKVLNPDGKIYRETDIATDMRNMVALYLKKAGVPYKTDGLDKVNLPLNQAGKLAEGTKVAVEFHCNAFSDPKAKGVEALAQTKDKQLSRELCEAVSKHMLSPVRGTDGGWKNEGSGQHSKLFFVQKGGIILELFFISNPTELVRWEEVKWLVAREVAEVLIKAVGGTKLETCPTCGQSIK